MLLDKRTLLYHKLFQVLRKTKTLIILEILQYFNSKESDLPFSQLLTYENYQELPLVFY